MFHAITQIQDVVSRPFEGEKDFWRVRSLLIDTYPITPVGFNWEIRRWDGWRYHRECTSITPEWSERLHIWETEEGCLVGVAHPENDGSAFFELHPDYRHIEEEMIAWAEAYLAVAPRAGQPRQLEIAVFDYDAPRRHLLEKRAYAMLPYTFVTRRLRFGSRPLPQPEAVQGYLLRSTNASDDDYARVAAVLNAGFNRTMHTTEEFRNFATQSPSFRHDLNLVAEAPDGSFAALVGVTYDETNRRAIIEPVCTHPDHRRKGLARALMLEGMRRVRMQGAADVMVDTGDAVAANALYDEIGFTEAYRGNIWRKVL